MNKEDYQHFYHGRWWPYSEEYMKEQAKLTKTSIEKVLEDYEAMVVTLEIKAELKKERQND